MASLLMEDEMYEELAYDEAVYEEPVALAPDLNGLAYNAVFRDDGVNNYGVTAYDLRSGDVPIIMTTSTSRFIKTPTLCDL